MSNLIRKYFIVALLSLGVAELGYAQCPPLPREAFGMADLAVNAGLHPLVGDTIQIVVAFQANLTGQAVLHLHFPGYIAPPNQEIGETERDSIVRVDSGAMYSYTLPFKLFQYGGSLVSISLRCPSANPAYKSASSSNVEIIHSPSTFAILN